VSSGSAPDRPLHVKQVKGRWYWDPPDRLRRALNLKTVALGADQGNAWAYAAKLNAEHLQLGPTAARVGSVRWVFAKFLESERAKSLADSTRRDYKWLAERVIQPVRVGSLLVADMPAMGIKARHADRIYELIAQERGHATGHYATRFARRVWKWAARRELVDATNPWAGMELRSLPKRTQLWTPELVRDVVAAAEKGGRPSLGLATVLGYWLGYRQADILGLTWTALKEGFVETAKTGRRLPVDVTAYPELEAALRGLDRTSTQVVIREGSSGPYQRHTFSHEWRAVADAAGVPRTLQFRDLRATALTELADSGADIIPMSTHSGHQTVQMARRYARPTADQFRAAAEKRVAHRLQSQVRRRSTDD
jgi:Phage integrase family